MSKLNTTCDLTSNYVNVIGEIKYPIDSVTVNKPRTSKGVASDIINEILENAMDAATTKSSLTTISQGENLCKKKILTDDTKFLETISDMDNNNENEQTPVHELVDGLRINNPPEEPTRLDVEMKRFLNDIMSPTSDYENLPRKDGVGDQASIIDESNVEDENLFDNDCPRIVEKKSRATDLIMNSKQLINEYLITEEDKRKHEEWEVSKENVIQVINLDCVQPEDVEHLMEKVNLTSAESGATSCDDYDDDEDDGEETITQMPKDNMLDEIDLSTEAFEKEEKEVCCFKEENHGGKGDEYKKTQDVNMLPRSSKSLPSSSTHSGVGLNTIKKDKKKKWNFGNKIVGFFRKHSLKHHQHNKSSPDNSNEGNNGE